MNILYFLSMKYIKLIYQKIKLNLQSMNSNYNSYKQEYQIEQENKLNQGLQSRGSTSQMRKINNLNIQLDITSVKNNEGKVYMRPRSYNKNKVKSTNCSPDFNKKVSQFDTPLNNSRIKASTMKYQTQSAHKLYNSTEKYHKIMSHCNNSLIQKLGKQSKIFNRYSKNRQNSPQINKNRSKSVYLIRKQILSNLIKAKELQNNCTEKQNLQQLTKFQMQEIETKNYSIYYKGNKRYLSRKEFTDRQGFPIAKIGDSIQYRYEILEVIEKTPWSVEYKCKDHKQKQIVLMKIFRTSSNLSSLADKQVEILKKANNYSLMTKSNIVQMLQYFVFRYHTCVTYEMLSYSLNQHLIINKSKSIPQPILIKLAINLLYSLIFLSNNKIVHCGINLENIKFKHINKTGLRLTNFVHSSSQQQRHQIHYQNLLYQAPEIILGNFYTPAIDMWSFGCLLAELYTGYPLFNGKSQKQLIAQQIQILGHPPKTLLEKGSKTKKIFNNNYELKISHSSNLYRAPKNLSFEKALLNCTNKQFVDLIKKCIVWQPTKRITPSKALIHEWILSKIPQEIRSDHIKKASGLNKQM